MNRILKKEGIDFNIKTGEIKLPYQKFNDIPIGLRFYIGQCIKLQYNVQYEIDGNFKVRTLEKVKPEKKKNRDPDIKPRQYIRKETNVPVPNQIELF
jgi:hypothetical protein